MFKLLLLIIRVQGNIRFINIKVFQTRGKVEHICTYFTESVQTVYERTCTWRYVILVFLKGSECGSLYAFRCFGTSVTSEKTTLRFCETTIGRKISFVFNKCK
jgi:hypothetical protein